MYYIAGMAFPDRERQLVEHLGNYEEEQSVKELQICPLCGEEVGFFEKKEVTESGYILHKSCSCKCFSDFMDADGELGEYEEHLSDMISDGIREREIEEENRIQSGENIQYFYGK